MMYFSNQGRYNTSYILYDTVFFPEFDNKRLIKNPYKKIIALFINELWNFKKPIALF